MTSPVVEATVPVQRLQTSWPKVASGQKAAAVMSAMLPSSTDENGNRPGHIQTCKVRAASALAQR